MAVGDPGRLVGPLMGVVELTGEWCQSDLSIT